MKDRPATWRDKSGRWRQDYFNAVGDDIVTGCMGSLGWAIIDEVLYIRVLAHVAWGRARGRTRRGGGDSTRRRATAAAHRW